MQALYVEPPLEHYMLNPGKVPLEPCMGTHDCSHALYKPTVATSDSVRMILT